jgi:hypothetical protein
MIAACGVNGLTCALVQVGGYFIRSGVIKSIVAIGLAAGLAGCSNSRHIERDEATPASTSLEAAPASPGLEAKPSPLNLNDALADCRSGYPDQITQAVARAVCIIKATEQLRPLLPFPDLLDRENALRKSIAEQVQNGSISLLERNRQMTKFHAGIVAEEQARLKEKPTEVGATVAATQWRLSNPDGCMSLGGNTANCY